MWALVIEDVAKSIEAALLCTKRRRWRFRRVLLQRAMHALVTTVLLRSACLNAFMHDPKLHPAEREFRKSHEPRARKRRAIVGPDSSGHSVLPHSCFTDRSNLAKVYARDDLTTNQITAVRIGDRKRIAASTDKSKCRFSVIKVNHKSRFFGINRSVNSLVPYEATKVRLGPHEYLVWFEGIYPDKPTVTKAFPGPTHLQFLRVNDEATEPAEERELLQDLVNLSGANWRGFNAKSSPVSVFYCHLVADLVHNFHERGLPMPAVQDIQPWFL